MGGAVRFKGQVIERVAGALLCVMCIVVLLQVAGRYLLRVPIAWTEEAGRFLLIWVSFLAAALGVRRRAHFRVEYFIGLLPSRMRKNIEIIVLLATMIVLMLVVAYGTRLTFLVKDQVSPAMRISMAYVYSALPVCAGVMLIEFVRILLAELLPVRLFGKRKTDVAS